MMHIEEAFLLVNTEIEEDIGNQDEMQAECVAEERNREELKVK